MLITPKQALRLNLLAYLISVWHEHFPCSVHNVSVNCDNPAYTMEGEVKQSDASPAETSAEAKPLTSNDADMFKKAGSYRTKIPVAAASAGLVSVVVLYTPP